VKIANYLIEIEHAVSTVIGEIYRESDQLAEIKQELVKLNAATEDGYRRVEFLAMNPELDDEGLGTAIHWDTYFGPDKERFHKQSDHDEIESRLNAHELSIAALSGSLLQYAKQGISLQYGNKRTGCPQGRVIAGIDLHDVIWQGRNQSIHWEDGSFHNPTENCFQTLAQNLDPIFNDYKNRNMAFAIVKALNWKSVDDFKNDMKLLDP
jgi:hypothetical protein